MSKKADKGRIESIVKQIDERIQQHTDNLRSWKDGTLTPTEPDEEGREMIKRELLACIHELKVVKQFIKNRG